jgi:hypothetical protein
MIIKEKEANDAKKFAGKAGMSAHIMFFNLAKFIQIHLS